MLLNKTKTFVFLFTIFISSFTFSQSTIYLETDACIANTNSGSQSATSLTLIYTDSDSSTTLNSSDNVDTTTSDNSIDFTDSTPYYYVENAQLRQVSFSTMPATGMVSFVQEDTTCDPIDDGDGGRTIYLETDACIANTNSGSQSATSLTLIYTDSDSSTTLNSSDNVDTTTSDNSIDFTDSTPYYYVENAQLRQVSFSTMPATGMVSFVQEDTTCDPIDDGDGGRTIYLETDACIANTNSGSQSATSLTLIYTDSDSSTTLNSSDNVDTTTSDNSIDFTDSTPYYYVENAQLRQVSFSTMPATGMVSFVQEDTTCDPIDDGDGGRTIYLETDACIANTNSGSQSATSLTLIYTDSDSSTTLNSSDNVDTTTSDNSIDFTDSTPYYYVENAQLRQVSFSTMPATGMVSFVQEDTTCDPIDDGDGGRTIYLETDACIANTNSGSQSATSLTLIYTDSDSSTTLNSSDNVDTTTSDNSIDFTDSTPYYYVENAQLRQVSFSTMPATGMVSFVQEDTTCDPIDDGDGGRTIYLETDACIANTNSGSQSATSLTLIYTDSDSSTTLNSSDNVDTTTSDNSIDFTDSTPYYYVENAQLRQVSFSTMPATGMVSFVQEDTTCDPIDDGDGGRTIYLETDACIANTNSGSQSATSLTLIYTDSDSSTTLNSSDNVDTTTSDNSIDFTDSTPYYYVENAQLRQVSFSTMPATGMVSFVQEDTTCDPIDDGDGGRTIYLETDACIANTNSGSQSATSLTLIYTDSDSSTTLNSSDNVDTTTSDNSIDFTDSTPYYYVENAQLRQVSFSTMPATGMVSFVQEDTTCDPIDDGDGGRTIYLETDACIANTNSGSQSATSLTLIYTDSDSSTTLNSSDNVDTTTSDNSIDFTDSTPYYYVENAQLRQVSFSTMPATGMVSFAPEDTTCDPIDDGDEISPEFDETPSISSVAQTEFTLTVDINEEGIIYYVVVADGAAAPTSSDVVNGTGNGVVAAVTSDNASVTTGGFTNAFSVTGLTAGTDYDVYVVARDDEGSPNLQGSPTKLDVTTAGLISLTITGLSGGDKVYDDTTAATATGTATLSGIIGADDVILGGSPVFIFASANVGTGITINTSGYTISGTDSGNYTLTQPTLSGDITAAPLTVTASDQTKVYGSTDPTLTYSITGFQGTDTEADLDTAVSISRAVGEDVGTYTITPSAAADSNYTVSFVTADFTITAADLTVTASDQTKVYGATDPTLTYSITGFQGTDTEADLDTAVSISRAVGEDVGTYTITPSAAADSNYTVSFVTADFTITAADLTVTAIDQTKVYGATDPTLTYSITGFQGTDTEADLDTAVSISRAVGEDVGTYTITPSAAADSNYTVSFVTADFTITAADLTVTAIDQTKVYGATDPTLTYSITGFQGTDTEADLDTAVSISRAAGEDVGTYTITPSAAADSNYTVSFVTADFTITAADLTVTASDQTKVYGATDPTLTYSITGFQGTDTEADLDTAVSISRAVGEDVGTYTITPSAAADSNYTVSFVTADFTITAADLTVTAIDQTKVYGATDPTLTYSITGFQGTDTEADLDTAVSISRAAGEDVGTYTITPSAAADSNYTVSFVTADFTITAADLTVTASDQTKVYGATDPTLTYSITGFQGTDTEADLDTAVSISRAVGEDVGTYTITPSAAADSNYTVSFVTADFTITAADLTVTASDAEPKCMVQQIQPYL